ncbi:TrmH family RNA methyltransferase [Mucilaginibacter arboris]|uniref:RNA methyltransferase n=1 Tax=Mucilaginibacter arboris TaxID=2682090 RepID=A0A7K1SZC9_9SPHI|nr:RNA methyltransferase [Mucilaginibacter arboris]MVN22676.1 RNA methyltransferase [Mucilaginibacter arboris]
MVSKSQISFLKSLQQKKHRKEHGLFLVEGLKSVTDFLQSDFYTIKTVYHTPLSEPKMLKVSGNIKFQEVSAAELEKISSLNTPQEVIAVVEVPGLPELKTQQLAGKFTLLLDGVQDPGNLGTIIRTADWFGISNIICSEDTVDVYNPKVVQATMGSLSRIAVHYTNMLLLLAKNTLPVFGAMLNGENIYQTDFGTEGLIVLGNEGKGIRPEIQQLVQKNITIPQSGKAESLNVAIAAAIFCNEISRNRLK